MIDVLAYSAAVRLATNYLLIMTLGLELATLLARTLACDNTVEAP